VLSPLSIRRLRRLPAARNVVEMFRAVETPNADEAIAILKLRPTYKSFTDFYVPSSITALRSPVSSEDDSRQSDIAHHLFDPDVFLETAAICAKDYRHMPVAEVPTGI
jgi:hypothetical protein